MTRQRTRPPVTRPQEFSWRRALLAGLEAAALLGAALAGVMALLGHAADWFTGTGLWSHVVPFAGVVLVLAIAAAALLRAWLKARRWLVARLALAPLLIALVVLGTAAWLVTRPAFRQEIKNLQTLIGGAASAERTAIAHQVYATYRRSDLTEFLMIMERARVYEATIHEAARAFGVDAEVLMGVGAAESSFYPRDSADGGRGIFQITSPPASAVAAARKQLQTSRLDPYNQRHNAFVAAATFARYLDEMDDDLFLGLLAYNIGPRNGGLRSIMQQYGARDFVTIQPYLKNLPRDYPVRVLSRALAYRVWRTEGRLLQYQEGNNAHRIQQLGIPGLAPTMVRRVVDPDAR